ncbi:hypothetical protein HGH92_26545 [Chitinophaga varians]|uniref:Uncharacterized protein n=1 Tax=Chitinophaga varians TaxID=2202339 RepID=A0A847RXV3_9BACT|nr:hypothetical protein [Chitinophaga varians]NLR67892.1 hypothetical protein [Chitinophaga varians]
MIFQFFSNYFMYFTSILHLAHDGERVSITVTLLNAKSSRSYEHINIMESKKWYILDVPGVPNLVNSFQFLKIKVPVEFKFQVISDSAFSVELLSTLIGRLQSADSVDNLEELYGRIVAKVNRIAKVILPLRRVSADRLALLESALKSECDKFQAQSAPGT